MCVCTSSDKGTSKGWEGCGTGGSPRSKPACQRARKQTNTVLWHNKCMDARSDHSMFSILYTVFVCKLPFLCHVLPLPDQLIFTIPIHSFRLQTTLSLPRPRTTLPLPRIPLLCSFRSTLLIFYRQSSRQNQPLRFFYLLEGYRSRTPRGIPKELRHAL